MEILPSGIEFQIGFSIFVFNSYMYLSDCWKILNLGVASAAITTFIKQKLADCWELHL